MNSSDARGREKRFWGSDGLPMVGDEGLLGPFLGGADRAFFDRMFNLGHDRLATRREGDNRG